MKLKKFILSAGISTLTIVACKEKSQHIADTQEQQKISVEKQTKLDKPKPVEKQINSIAHTAVSKRSENTANTSKTTVHSKKNTTPSTQTQQSSHNKKEKKIVQRANIKFEEPIFNFGEISEGTEINHKFKFKNTGTSILEIKGVEASCGCTRPSYPFVGIKPDHEGFIGVNYNSVNKNGPQNPVIKIFTNIQIEPYVIYLKGNVVEKNNAEHSNSTLENTEASIDSIR